ncbi:hypothetical protein L204_103744 [Cryptococcus depauperatus]|nr:mitochondrial protein [Cryptococcus depauperatus CBS 7855]
MLPRIQFKNVFQSIEASSKNILQPRCRYQSDGPRPPRLSSLDSFASELLTSPSSSPSLSSGGNKRSAQKANSLPEIHLSPNPWADSYTVSEEDLEDPFEVDIALDNQPSPSSPRRRRLSRRRKIQPSHQPDNVLVFSPHESVSVFPNFISFTSHGRSGVITNARLYDSCTCRRCLDFSTRQKHSTTGDAVRGSKITRITKGRSLKSSDNSKLGLVVSYGTDSRHTAFYPIRRLRSMIETNSESVYRTPTFVRQTWDGEYLPFTNLRFQYPNLSESLLKILEQLQVYGIVVIEGVPTDPTSDKDCMLRKIVGMIGEIRNTFYGETWDVKSMRHSKNVAYTNLNLGLHMDLLYFSSPPRFQALHCLRNRVRGGISYFVDSFRTVQDLPKDQFDLLQKITIPYKYDNDQHFLRYQHPIISPDFGNGLTKLHAAVNWSPPFRAPADALDFSQRDPIAAAEHEKKIYQAIASFEERLSDPRYRHQFTMQEGDLVLFDNRRILHARTAFQDGAGDADTTESLNAKSNVTTKEPTRWLKGCYLDGEVVWDKLAILRKESLQQKIFNIKQSHSESEI